MDIWDISNCFHIFVAFYIVFFRWLIPSLVHCQYQKGTSPSLTNPPTHDLAHLPRAANKSFHRLVQNLWDFWLCFHIACPMTEQIWLELPLKYPSSATSFCLQCNLPGPSHKHLFVWIITPTGLSVPASAPYSLNSTKYPEWSYQNIIVISLLCSKALVAHQFLLIGIRSSYDCLQALSCLAFYLSGPISCFFPLTHSRQHGLPVLLQHTRHAPTWHPRVP